MSAEASGSKRDKVRATLLWDNAFEPEGSGYIGGMNMDGSPRLFVWNYTPEEKARLDAFLQEVGAPPAVAIRRDQGHLLVRELIHTETHADEEFTCDEKVLLFYRISPKGISFLIDQSKHRNLPRPIYAAVTEHSIQWTFSELVEHLIAEREEIRKTQQQSQ